MLIYWAAAPLVVAAYVWACTLVYEVPAGARRPFLVALLVYLPFPLLRALYLLPGLAWFALIGLAVPAALVERIGVRAALARGRRARPRRLRPRARLARRARPRRRRRRDTLIALLHTQSEASARVALALADVVLSPLLYLGGALLYADQAARVGSPRSERRRNGR